MYLPHTLAGIGLCVALSGLMGCAPTSVAGPGANNVRITHNEPGRECQFLGDVTGSQGNFLLGSITGNAELETGARNDLKNKAAAIGGNRVYLLTQRAGQTGSDGRLEQTNVTLSGNVYHCPER
ncbi:MULTISPECIES: DUF4156 domain-containing protein [Pseudomonas]|uniref:DUF4156 domain-containing protein n=1 Tax=Pseudomonas TaxID=286 RepID=UPI000643694A|nr:MULTISPECIES: DUF4156 domain-containing protein [Pseudomonas]